MRLNYKNEDKSALEAKFDAQKIAFAPIMFQAAKALRDLGILELICQKRKEGITKEDIAKKLNISVYGVKVLLEAGLSLEIVEVREDKFTLTKTGWFILKDELTRINMDFTNDVNYLGMFSLIDSIKTGKPTGLKVFGNWPTVYEGLFQLPQKALESWLKYDHYYSDYAFGEILPIVFSERVNTLLDVGGNTGKFALRCVKYDKDVTVKILDLEQQIEQAQQNIKEQGYLDRIEFMPLDLLNHSVPFPKNADVIWMSQFLDCFSQEDVLQLLIRGKNAMSKNSAFYILETYWDKQKFQASTYSLHATSLYFTNIANGCSQMYHSRDMLNLIEKAGLFVEKSYEDIGVSHTLLKCKVK